MRSEAFFTGQHGHYIDDTYLETEVAFSLLRFNPAEGNFSPENTVDDKTFVQFLCALRLYMPRAGIIVSTREPAAFRDNLISLGVTRFSAGSCTGVGGLKVDMLRENLLRICPDLKITTIADRLTDSNLMRHFSACSVIVEGFDKAEEKKMLLEEFAGDRRLVVSASGIAGSSVESISIRNYGNCSIAGEMYLECQQIRKLS